MTSETANTYRTSGIFRISVRREQGAIGVEGVGSLGVVEVAGPLPRKKSFLSPK